MKELVVVSTQELEEIIYTAVARAFDGKPSIPESDPLLTRAEMKIRFGIASDATVIRYEKAQILQPIRLGKKIFYRKSQVENSLKRLERV